jgi:hypothetical protein
MKLLLSVALLLISNLVLAQPEKNILFNAFKQGIVEVEAKKGGNCTSVAIIKAAIGVHGVDSVFKIEKKATTNVVTLKDERTFEISDVEIAFASTKAKFIPGDTIIAEVKKVYEYALLCFAVLCKSEQQLNRKDKSYEYVVDKVNTGYTTSEIYNLLGLKKIYLGDNPSYETLKQYKNVLVWNSAHAVYYSEGYYDEAADKNTPIEKIENLKKHHWSFGGWLKNRGEPRGAQVIIK